MRTINCRPHHTTLLVNLHILKEVLILARCKRVEELNGSKVVRAINERVVSFMRYSTGVVEWTKAELEAVDRKTRTLVTIYG